MTRPPPTSTLFPYTTLFRSSQRERKKNRVSRRHIRNGNSVCHLRFPTILRHIDVAGECRTSELAQIERHHRMFGADRKSTRLNSSHVAISYAVFCLKKKKQI